MCQLDKNKSFYRPEKTSELFELKIPTPQSKIYKIQNIIFEKLQRKNIALRVGTNQPVYL